MRGAAATGLVVVVVALGVLSLAFAGRGDEPRAAGAGSTLDGTFADPDGDGVLAPADGERLRDRTELAGAARPVRELARFAQISDAHVRDEESPARAVLLDRLGPPFTSAFRPHEALSAQTLAATVRSLNALDPDAVLVTGDLIDSAQGNELDLALGILRGGRVDPDSGAPGYDGPQAATNADPFVYRPDVDAPRHAGLLGRAQRPFRSPGLRAPWYPLVGNHELLVQGEVPPTAALERLATGGRAISELPRGERLPRDTDGLTPGFIADFLEDALTTAAVRVPPDGRRAHLGPPEMVERLRPAGVRRAPGARLDYAFDVGRQLRVIALDVVRRAGGSRGLVGAAQVAWLRRQLERAGDRWVVVASHQPLASSDGGEAALAELDRHPRVLAAIAGHTHDNSIEPRQSAAGGYWLVETASLADHPQQARAFRLAETAGGGVALETWMVDHAGGELTQTARGLAFLDAQGGRPAGSAGSRLDRNVRLHR